MQSAARPHPCDDTISRPVSRRIGNVKNNDPSLLKPIVFCERAGMQNRAGR
jgi:hypothetical protein